MQRQIERPDGQNGERQREAAADEHPMAQRLHRIGALVGMDKRCDGAGKAVGQNHANELHAKPQCDLAATLRFAGLSER